ncbi:MAG: GDSL-type esterase/lipase family protein [Firmicutes bacterium]|nr:GDSL-type esterase/lipase family protein [Bacillota bacterium]
MNKRIAVWGDSLLKGVVYDDDARRYRFLPNTCLDLIASVRQEITFTNCSQYGQTSDRALAKMKQALKTNHDFDFAIIELGGNDCDFDWKEVSASPTAPHSPHIALSDFHDNIVAMVNECRAYGITPVMVNLPPINAERYFNFFSVGLEKQQILLWLLDVNNIYHTQEMYSLEIDAVARDLNVRLINIREQLLSEKNYNTYLCSDGIHLNEKGHNHLKDIITSSPKYAI